MILEAWRSSPQTRWQRYKEFIRTFLILHTITGRPIVRTEEHIFHSAVSKEPNLNSRVITELKSVHVLSFWFFEAYAIAAVKKNTETPLLLHDQKKRQQKRKSSTEKDVFAFGIESQFMRDILNNFSSSLHALRDQRRRTTTF